MEKRTRVSVWGGLIDRPLGSAAEDWKWADSDSVTEGDIAINDVWLIKD